VQENTYYAELHLYRGEDVFHIDARPSDSIAIALRLAAPIFAQESLLTEISVEDADESTSAGEGVSFTGPEPEYGQHDLSAEQLKAYLEKMRPEDFGKLNL